MNAQQFLLVLKARWLVAAIVMAVTVLSTAVISLILPSNYTATTALVADFRGMDPIVGAFMPVQLLPSYMATQMDIIQSHAVALKVVKGLGLAASPAAQEEFKEETDGKGTIEDWLAEVLLKQLEVKPARDSSVINISYSAVHPKFAVIVADAFAKAYIDTTLELRVEPARHMTTWFDERTKALRDQVETAQAKMSAYQNEKGIVSLDERLDVENSRLAELSSQLTLLQGQVIEAQNREKKARELIAQGASPDQLIEVLANPLVIGLKSELTRIESRLQDTASQLGKNHPQYVRQQAEIREIRKRLAEEINNVVSGLSNTMVVNQRRASEIRNALNAQKAKVLALKTQKDELQVLTREAENAHRSFDVAMQRFAQTNLESHASQTNIAVLSPAVEPVEPSSPKVLLNIALSIVLGAMLGIGAAMAQELANRRIHSDADFRDAINVPLLGTLSRQIKRSPKRGSSLPRSTPIAVGGAR